MPLALDNDNPAYLLGRLWAHLNDLETAALGSEDPVGDICAAKWPGTVQSPANAVRHHATYAPAWEKRLRSRRKTRAANQITGQIAELLARIGTPPRLIGAESSSWFTLGYWHQRSASERDRAPELVESSEFADV